MIAIAKRQQCWPLSIQFLHWATVFLLIGLFVSGWMPGAHGVSSLHVTLGALLLAVVPVRIATRLSTRAPPPLSQHPIGIWTSRVNQIVLYLLMLVAIISGLAAFSPHPFITHAKLFGAFDLPAIIKLRPELRPAAAQSHGILVWLLLVAAASHIAAVLGHTLLTDRHAIRRMAGRAPVELMRRRATDTQS